MKRYLGLFFSLVVTVSLATIAYKANLNTEYKVQFDTHLILDPEDDQPLTPGPV